MAKHWAESQGETLVSQINDGKFYHKLTNTIAPGVFCNDCVNFC